MYQINRIKEYIEEVGSLELLADVYTDIARARLEKVRTGIERNRSFVNEIADVLHIVRLAAEEKGLSAKKKKKVSASLMITSSKRFYYGNLDSRVVDFYIAHTAYTGFVDRFVIGSVGADVLKGKGYPFPFETILFDRDLPNSKELVTLAEKLNDYQKVFVYYPQFITALSQQPSFVDITGLVATSPKTVAEKYYIFEPEIEKILSFFEEQVMAILLEQTFLDAELSRIGSQLTAMDNASINAGNIIRDQTMLLAQARRSVASMQVLEMVAGTMRKKYQQ